MFLPGFALALFSSLPIFSMPGSYLPLAWHLGSAKSKIALAEPKLKYLVKSFRFNLFFSLLREIRLHWDLKKDKDQKLFTSLFWGCCHPKQNARKALIDFQLETLRKEENAAITAQDIPLEYLKKRFQKLVDDHATKEGSADWSKGMAGLLLLEKIEEAKKLGWTDNRSTIMRHQVTDDLQKVFQTQFKRLDPITPCQGSQDFSIKYMREWIVVIATFADYMTETQRFIQEYAKDREAIQSLFTNPEQCILKSFRSVADVFYQSFRDHETLLNQPKISQEEKKASFQTVWCNFIAAQSLRRAAIEIANNSMRRLKNVHLHIRYRVREEQTFLENKVCDAYGSICRLHARLADPNLADLVSADARLLAAAWGMNQNPELIQLEKLEYPHCYPQELVQCNFKAIHEICNAIQKKYCFLERIALAEKFHPYPNQAFIFSQENNENQ